MGATVNIIDAERVVGHIREGVEVQSVGLHATLDNCYTDIRIVDVGNVAGKAEALVSPICTGEIAPSVRVAVVHSQPTKISDTGAVIDVRDALKVFGV